MSENWERLGMLAMREGDLQSATEALERIPGRDFDGIRLPDVLDAIAVRASSRPPCVTIVVAPRDQAAAARRVVEEPARTDSTKARRGLE